MTTTHPICDSSVCERLIRRAFGPDEFPSLVEAIFSSKDERDKIRSLSGEDAQDFVNVMEEALHRRNLSQGTWTDSLRLLYRSCGIYGLVPKALAIPVCYDRTSDALFQGGCADVWKGHHNDQDVAVKVIRMYSSTDLKKLVKRFCKEAVTWKFLRHQNVLPLMGVTITETRLALISRWMSNGNVNEFVKANPGVDRFKLVGALLSLDKYLSPVYRLFQNFQLAGVCEGLIYLHSRGMFHGDLKGSNILIDESDNACIADFGLLTMISDPANNLTASSSTQARGTIRWMSPEIMNPELFRLDNSRPTISSDCYALGMVIYETISGHAPFHSCTDISVPLLILTGKRPLRETGFPDGLWEMLDHCWRHLPGERPSIEDVLQCLKREVKPPSIWKSQEPVPATRSIASSPRPLRITTMGPTGPTHATPSPDGPFMDPEVVHIPTEMEITVEAESASISRVPSSEGWVDSAWESHSVDRASLKSTDTGDDGEFYIPTINSPEISFSEGESDISSTSGDLLFIDEGSSAGSVVQEFENEDLSATIKPISRDDWFEVPAKSQVIHTSSGVGPEVPISRIPENEPFKPLIDFLTKLWHEGKREPMLSEIDRSIMRPVIRAYGRLSALSIESYVRKAAAENIVIYTPAPAGTSSMASTVRLCGPPSLPPESQPPLAQFNAFASLRGMHLLGP